MRNLRSGSAGGDFFVNHRGEALRKADLAALPVLINCDSTYAANSVMGVLNGGKNKSLIDTIRVLYQDVRKKTEEAKLALVFAHVRGHSSHPWNDRADDLANRGGELPPGVRLTSTEAVSQPQEEKKG